MKTYVIWDNEQRKTVVNDSGEEAVFTDKNAVVRAVIDMETSADPTKTAGFGERYSWLIKAERPEQKEKG